MNRVSIVCVTLLVASAVSIARADVEFGVKKPPPAKPAASAAPAAAPVPAPAPVIAEKPGMEPPAVPGKAPPPLSPAAPAATTATWWGHAAWIIQTPGGATIAIDPWLDN